MTQLHRLPPGTRFRVPNLHRSGTVARRTPGAVTVSWDDAPAARSFRARNADGTEVTVTLQPSPSREIIAPGTEVEVLP